jgi:hypothetical protein
MAMKFLKKFPPFILMMVISTNLIAQNAFVKGELLDKNNLEPLPYANIVLLSKNAVYSTDSLGRFSIPYTNETDSLRFLFLGYQELLVPIHQINKDYTVLLESTAKTLQEIEIKALRSDALQQFENVRPGKQVLKKEVVLQLPALAGEPDFIKALTLLPGASKGIEGSSDFFVRGGAADQNLVLMDGATVYNTGHLFGFLSVFNPSTIGEVSMMTGGFPAEYGGRLSSIIDIRSKEPSMNRTFIEGGVGLISSRISVEQPIIKDKLAIQIAGRRTYADQVVRLASIDLPYYFYDVNINVNWKISDNSSLHYGYYRGDDILDFSEVRDENVAGDVAGTSFNLGNSIHTLEFNSQLENMTSTTYLHLTKFDYKINSYFQDNFINVIADIQDLGLSQKFTLKKTENRSFNFGFSAILRNVDPNLINSGGEISEIIPSSDGTTREVTETAIFGEWEFKKDNLEGIVGLRTSAAFLENTHYVQPEPRIAFRYSLNDNYALKASYTRMSQYVHRVSSSSFALPTDIWYPVDQDVAPQSADQFTLGLNKLMQNGGIVLSTEAYYKSMSNLVEYREGTNLVLNNDFKSALIQGDGAAYGSEWLLRKDAGKLRGWLSYTLSWTNRQFDELNNGKTFKARYDRRHNVSIVTNYDIAERWRLSAVWEFLSGARFTPIIGYYGVPNSAATGVDLIPVFPERNSVQLADAHRLDLSITFKGKQRSNKNWYGEWQFSIYNAYNRATPVAINIVYNEETDSYSYEQPGLIGLLPSISYNFKFYK